MTRGPGPRGARRLKGQCVVQSRASPLGTLEGSGRRDAPQIPDAASAVAVVTFQNDGVPDQLVAQRAQRRCFQHGAHFFACLCVRVAPRSPSFAACLSLVISAFATA